LTSFHPWSGLCVALVLLISACGKSANEPSKSATPQAEVGVDRVSFPKDSPQLATLRVVNAVLEQESFIRINGRASWNDAKTSRVSSSVSGRVVELIAMPGMMVKKGAVLAVVSSPEFGQIQAEARRAESDLQLSERTLKRLQELHTAGVIPTKELQSAEAEFQRNRAERTRTQIRERNFGGGNRLDQLFRIVAPIDGAVVDRRITIGQEVRADQAAEVPLFVISDPQNLWISLDVPESLTQEIQVDEHVRISAPALNGEVFQARIEYVADFIDPQTRTVKARASVDNAKRKLKADMYVTAEVEVPASEALKVPASALYLQGDKYFAFVEESPGLFVRHLLKAESAGLGTMRVTSGIVKGDRLVVDGALLLQQMLNLKANSPPAKKVQSDGKPASS
jgi:membrane fusion protein, heavy metal efflux system